MSSFIIKKSPPLTGSIKINGSKNAALPIIAATLLTDGECVLENVPPLSDVKIMLEILESLGKKVDYDEKAFIVKIFGKGPSSHEIDAEKSAKIRASFIFAGPILARKKKACIPFPGGCSIGLRPVDLHLKGFSLMGAKIINDHGSTKIRAKSLTGSFIYLDFPSVGATENLIMAASLAKGRTIIENAAEEPEIIDLSNFINKMGGKIRGAGTKTIVIDGVKSLKGASYTIIPDRIEAGTFMAAAAVTGGSITLESIIPQHLQPIICKLKEAGLNIQTEKNTMLVEAAGEIFPFNLKTMPFPGFPTDMQSLMMSLMSVAKGTSVITETIFENRFMNAGELKRMGADIKIESRCAIVNGVKKLKGTTVRACDLRSGAALIVSALAAEGETEIQDIYHIERGYYKIDERLASLGALIKKIP